jgi:hypothetical protein
MEKNSSKQKQKVFLFPSLLFYLFLPSFFFNMLSPEIFILDKEQTERLLTRLEDWRSGICPNGKLAKEPCFVLGERPCISIHPDQPKLLKQQSITSEIITEYDWADSLINCGAITHLDDEEMMQTMSEFFMLFHSRTDSLSNCNTLHSLQLRKHASFKVDNILRPTKLLQLKLDQLLQESDKVLQWNQLIELWNTFGYLWPRKIVLGHKTHLTQKYTFVNVIDSMNEYYFNLGLLKDKYHSLPKDPPFNLDQFLSIGTIISRLELAPLHEFLDKETKNAIHAVINDRFIKIPAYSPIKMYNKFTDTYLCWGPHTHQSQKNPVLEGERTDYLVRAISTDASELSKSPEIQYLWRFTWTPTAVNQLDAINTSNIKNADTFDPIEHRSQIIRGYDKVYIYPACKSQSSAKAKRTVVAANTSTINPTVAQSSKSHSWKIKDRMSEESNLIDTHKMVLMCSPYRNDKMMMYNPDILKLRGLRLLSNDLNQSDNEVLPWTIEYPKNNLKYMTDAQTNVKFNFHEHVRRKKPLVNGDVVQIQQIGLLAAFNPTTKSIMSDPPQQLQNISQTNQDQTEKSLRTTKRITRKPSIRPESKKNALCVDEEFTRGRYTENTYWTIELANDFDRKRHWSNFYRWPPSNSDRKYGYPNDYHPMLSQG